MSADDVAADDVCGPDAAGPRRRTTSSSRRWAVTLLATAVSTWALDATAAAAGLALAGSTPLTTASPPVLVVVLVATYACWAAGLAGNLRANGSLLDVAGVSTNAASKSAYDLAAARSPGRRRAAATIGYVATEVVKELPYVIGAFGVAAASTAVDRRDAVVFLAGANLGAMADEVAVAIATRQYLRRVGDIDTRKTVGASLPSPDGPGGRTPLSGAGRGRGARLRHRPAVRPDRRPGSTPTSVGRGARHTAPTVIPGVHVTVRRGSRARARNTRPSGHRAVRPAIVVPGRIPTRRVVFGAWPSPFASRPPCAPSPAARPP